jgi:hypothetical protein
MMMINVKIEKRCAKKDMILTLQHVVRLVESKERRQPQDVTRRQQIDLQLA